MSLFHRRSHSVTSSLALEYRNSFLGHDDARKNYILHSRLNKLFNGEVTEPRQLEWLDGALNYRLHMMVLATAYEDALQISADNCEANNIAELNAEVKEDLKVDLRSVQISEIMEGFELFDYPETH